MKVLLVDDEEDIRKVGRLSLEGVGKYTAVIACSAQEALELARAEQPDLILMDMMMPGMDGLQALAEVQADSSISHIPVIFMTARVQKADTERYMECGAVGVIHKPFDPMTLPDQIVSILQTAEG